jgi:class 3 adenylate cyclase/tetratricopeptide (TPR) repeat protein
MATCPTCGKGNPDGFGFCGFCGATLTGAEPGPSARERKVVTVLFCDLVGFTAASESADPEEVQARMAPYHARARERIEAFGGTVEKFIGDAVMAVFGAPVAHEDDAERAVRAALSILEAIDELNAGDGALALSVRVGVNTGEAVVSLDARPELGEGMVTGDVVNTAARIQSAAPVDGVAVGESTYRATDRIFEYDRLDPIVAKGKARPVQIWQAKAPVARFGSDVIRSLTTPLVGRETDLNLLHSLFDKSARDQDVQLVTIVGEPGVGKSRLVAELFAYIDERDELITWRQGRCLPYGEGITFWALGEIVKAHAGIYESDSAEQAVAKLDALLSAEDRDWLRARLEPLVGVESAQPPSREESFAAWRRFLEGIADDGPFVVVVEDIHWADDALLEFLEHVADWAQGVSLFVVCTARPELYERHPSWGAGLSNATAIRLSPLSDRDTARLVAELLGQAVLPAETQQVLLERAGGNPLYAEEFVRMLRDQELLDDRGKLRDGAVPSLPDSIQALIAARIDTLASDRKRLLQDAAVIGKVFWSGAVEALGDLDAQAVHVALHELVRKELVRPSRQSSMEREAEYGFWHALVRDVAYQQIPRAERADRHVAAAAWIEARSAERLEDVADVLVHHYETASDLYRAAGRTDRAEELLERVGRSLRLAAARAAVLDARLAADLYARSLASVASGDPTRGELLLEASETFRQVGRREEAHANLDEAEAWFRSRHDDSGVARVLLARSRIRQSSHTGDAVEPVVEAMRLLEGRPPGAELARAYAQMALTEYVYGHDEKVRGWADRSLALAKELGLTEEIDAIGARGGVRAARGDSEGFADMRRAVDLALAQQVTITAVRWLNNLAAEMYLWEGADSALRVVYEALALTNERGIVSFSLGLRGTVLEYLYVLGRWDDLVVEGEDLERSVVTHGLDEPPESSIIMARVLASRGDIQAARARFDAMLTTGRRSGEAQFLVMTLSVIAAAELAAGDAARARELLDELLELPDVRSSLNFGPCLPEIERTAIGVGGAELAETFLDGFEAIAPMHAHARRAAEASIAEARGEHAYAAETYGGAAETWRKFGFVPEEAYALLGRGRCLVALDEHGADAPLRDARAIFDRLGMRPNVAECDSLIARASRLSS